MYLSQSLGRSAAIRRSILSSVPLYFSHRPFAIGWYREEWIDLMDNNLMTSSISPDTNCGPLSLNIIEGIPTREKMPNNASATVSVSVEVSATASGYRVA